MDRLFARVVWLCDWAGVFALICAAGSLGLHYWFDGAAFTGALFLFGVFRWLGLAVIMLSTGRMLELGSLAWTGLDGHALATTAPATPALTARQAAERAAA